MDTNVMDRLLDRIQQQERDKLRLQRRLGRMAFHRNRAESNAREMERVVAESKEVSEKVERDLDEALVEELEAEIERLKTQAERRTKLHKEAVARYEAELAKLRNGGLTTEKAKCYAAAKSAVEGAHRILTEMGVEDGGLPLVDRMGRVSSEIQSLRERRDRLIVDNTALATARDEYRKEKHELEDELRQLKDAHAERKEEYMMLSQARHDLEDELRQVRHTLSMEQDLIRELHREGRQHRDFGFQVRKHSESIYRMACEAVGLEPLWDQERRPAAQGEADDG